MDVHLGDLQVEIDSALADISSRYGEEIAAILRSILHNNINNGRFNTFCAEKTANLSEYIHRVLEYYLHTHLYIEKLQVEKDDLAWMPLYSKISCWVFNLFVHKGFDREYTRHEIVPELSQESAIQLMKAQFTYDTEFEPWAYMVVRATCLKYMRSAMKKTAVPANALVELDERVENRVEDPRYQTEDVLRENHTALLTAIDRLTPDRREIIIQKYFYELPAEKIAENTHRSIPAVYSMHFNAIENLRKILSD